MFLLFTGNGFCRCREGVSWLMKSALRAALLVFSTTCITGAASESMWAISIGHDAPSGVFFAGEPAKLTLLANSSVAEPKPAKVSIQILDDQGQTHDKEFTINPEDGVRQKIEFELPSSEPGFYEVKLDANHGAEAKRDYTFVLVPRPQLEDVPFDEAMFGAAFFKDLHAAERIGVRFVRTLVHWKFTEPHVGQYYWGELDPLLESAQERNMGVILTAVIREGPPWAQWKTPMELMSSAYSPHYTAYIKAITQRLSDAKIPGAIEIQNEPDISLEYVNKMEVSPAAVTASYLLKVGARAVRDVDSDIPVLGMGVSGMDFRAGLPLSRQALNSASMVADYLAQHPYTERRFVGKKFDWPCEYPMVEYWSQSKQLAKQHSRKGEVWSTELGWGVDANTEQFSEDSRTLAAVLVRAMSTSYGEGIRKFAWFGGQLSWQEKGNRFSLFWKQDGEWYPTLAAGAYANCARLLEGSESQGRMKLQEGVIAYQFNFSESERSILVLWAEDQKVTLRGRANRDVTMIDLMGREKQLASGPWTTELSTTPIYLVADQSTNALHDLLSSINYE